MAHGLKDGEYFKFVRFIIDCMATAANYMAKRNVLDHGCGDSTLTNISAGEYYSLSGSYISNSLLSHRNVLNATINILN
jgi:hypothetical protein